MDTSKLARVDYMADKLTTDLAYRNSILSKICKVRTEAAQLPVLFALLTQRPVTAVTAQRRHPFMLCPESALPGQCTILLAWYGQGKCVRNNPSTSSTHFTMPRHFHRFCSVSLSWSVSFASNSQQQIHSASNL